MSQFIFPHVIIVSYCEAVQTMIVEQSSRGIEDDSESSVF